MQRLRERIDRFSFFDWAPNPLMAILWRELLTTLRQRRYGVILVAAAGILLLIILENLGRMAYWTISPAMLVTNVLSVQYSALLAFVYLVVPALAAVTLATERQHKTEDLLYTALFRPLTLVAGKLLAVLAVFAVFHIALLPLAAFIYFFAGIEIRSFFQVQFLLYTTALFHTIIGLMVSRITEAPNRAVFIAYVFVAGLYGVPYGWTYFANLQLQAAGAPMAAYPPEPVTLVSSLLASTAGWAECGRLVLRQGLGTVAIGLFCVAGALMQAALERASARIGWGGGQQRKPFGPIPDWGNPIYHKDRRTMPAARLRPALALFVLFAALAYAFNHWSAAELEFSMSALDAGAVALYVLIPFLVIDSCNKEMAPNSLILVRLTRLGSDSVLTGKALAILHIVLPMALGLAAGTAAIVATRGMPSLNAGPGPGQSLLLLWYAGFILIPKLILAIALCFAFARFRAPSPADLATNLALSGATLAIAESISHGLFQSMLNAKLDAGAIAIIVAGHLICLGFTVIIVFAIAQMRFETVFDEGSDIYAISHVDRRNF